MRPPSFDSQRQSTDPEAQRAATERSSTTRRRYLAGIGSLGAGIFAAGCGGRGSIGGDGNGDEDGGGDQTPGTDTDDGLGPTPELLGPWPQVRADAANTGFVTAGGPTADPSLRWTTDSAGTVGAAVGQETGTAASPDGTYVVAEDGRVAAVDSAGETRWRTTLGAAQFPPAVGSEYLVVPERERLAVLDAASGDRLRTIDVPDGILNAPTLAGTRALVGTFSGGVVAVDVEQGERLWQSGDPSRANPPTVVDGTAYVTARRWETEETEFDRPGVIVAVDVESGETQWQVPLDGHPTASPGVRDGVVYAGTNRGNVHAVDAESGDRQWREAVGDWVTRGPTVADDGLYVVVLGEGVAKLSTDGTVLWQSDAGGATNPMLADDVAIVGTDEGVVAVGREDGETRWQGETDAGVEFDVHIGERTVYAGDQYGTLSAFDVETGDPEWRYPFRPATVSGPIVGRRTVAGGSRDGGTYQLLTTEGTEFPLLGGAATIGLSPVCLRGELSGDESGSTGTAGGAATSGGTEATSGSDPVETLLGGGTDGAIFRARTTDGGDAPTTALRPTATPTATPGPDEPTRTPTPHIDYGEPDIRWESTLDVELRSPITYADGRAYIGTDEGVVAIDPRNGQVRWRVDLGDAVSGAPAAIDDRVVVVTRSGRLAALRTGGEVGSEAANAEGRERIYWDEQVAERAESGPTIDSGSVFATENDGRIHAYTIEGEPQWTQSLDTGVRGGTAVTDRRAFVGTDRGEVVALDRSDGSVQWRTEARGAVRTAPAVADDGSGRTVYASDHAGTLSALDATDGTVRFRLDVGRWADSPPAVGHGAVFVADQTGRVFAVVGD